MERSEIGGKAGHVRLFWEKGKKECLFADKTRKKPLITTAFSRFVRIFGDKFSVFFLSFLSLPARGGRSPRCQGARWG
jgi:hypothetical protein